MKARLIYGILALVLALCAAERATADEVARELIERDLLARHIRDLIWKGGYSDLEAMAEEYRTQNSRTASGMWKLGLFYRGLGEAYVSCAISCEDLIEDWIDSYPDSGTARLAYADLLLFRAWEFRGDGYANKVKPEAWKPFYEKIAEARAYLEKYKLIASQDPQWYVQMATVAKAEDWPEDQFMALIEEGLHRASLYYPLYFSAVEYYMPKWHGSAADIEAFARWAAERTHAAEGLGMYARIYWSAFDNQYYEKLFLESDVVWADMSAGIDDVLKAFPDQWNVNNFAYFACLAGDHHKTLELMKRIEGNPALAVWRSYDEFNRCKQFAEQGAG